MSKSNLCKFYDGSNHPYIVKDIPYWSDYFLEETHDYIQWVFPLDTVSEYNPNAPILTKEDVLYLRAQPSFHALVRGIYGRMMLFLSTNACFTPNNHNLLRVTRMLKSLRLMGFEYLSEDMCEYVIKMTSVHKIDKSVLAYWADAMKTPVYIGE